MPSSRCLSHSRFYLYMSGNFFIFIYFFFLVYLWISFIQLQLLSLRFLLDPIRPNDQVTFSQYFRYLSHPHHVQSSWNRPSSPTFAISHNNSCHKLPSLPSLPSASEKWREKKWLPVPWSVDEGLVFDRVAQGGLGRRLSTRAVGNLDMQILSPSLIKVPRAVSSFSGARAFSSYIFPPFLLFISFLHSFTDIGSLLPALNYGMHARLFTPSYFYFFDNVFFHRNLNILLHTLFWHGVFVCVYACVNSFVFKYVFVYVRGGGGGWGAWGVWKSVWLCLRKIKNVSRMLTGLLICLLHPSLLQGIPTGWSGTLMCRVSGKLAPLLLPGGDGVFLWPPGCNNAKGVTVSPRQKN